MWLKFQKCKVKTDSRNLGEKKSQRLKKQTRWISIFNVSCVSVLCGVKQTTASLSSPKHYVWADGARIGEEAEVLPYAPIKRLVTSICEWMLSDKSFAVSVLMKHLLRCSVCFQSYKWNDNVSLAQCCPWKKPKQNSFKEAKLRSW